MVITVNPAPAAAPDTRAPAARIRGVTTQDARVRVAFTSDEPGAATATLRSGGRSAVATVQFARAGRHIVTVRLSRPLRRLPARRITATLTLGVTDDTGNGTTLRRTLRFGRH